jgi:hypothetical protein
LFILIPYLFALTACTQKSTGDISKQTVPIPDVVSHAQLSDDVQVRTEWGSHRGIGIGYVRPNEKDLPPDKRTQNDEFQLEEGQPFSPYLILFTPKQQDVFVTVLLDFQQVEFELDGKYGLLHQLSVSPGGYLELPLQVNINQPGIHELIVLAFADPYDGSLDIQERMSWAETFVGKRAIVIMGEDDTIATILPEPVQGEPIPEDVRLGLHASFASHTTKKNSHPSDRQLYVAQAEPDETFEYDLWVSNHSGEMGADYAIMLFNNFHQVPIEGNDVLVVHLEPDEELMIPTSQKMTTEPGVNQMQLIHVFDPYRSILNDEVRASFVFGSARLAIDTSD